MQITTLKKQKEKIVNWITPQSEKTTIEEYLSEMKVAENSGFISFEEHKKNMNQWLTEKL